MSSPNSSRLRLYNEFRRFLRERFDLEEDQASELQTIEEIRRQVVFRGTNLWILMFAIIICSVGLNVNSPAVVVGAMLISPLMGPIMGVGMGVGINDFQLIIKAVKNWMIAAVLSILVSAVYFSITPIHEAQSELLARTQPTLWDVVIALFGGLAGIVAGSRREKSNAIPGVAIATALMPPLCTAGYGVATGQWNYFFGASYLFFINSVFISLATIVIVRYLRFPKKEFVDSNRENKVRQYITVFVILTIIPSIFTGYRVVQKTVFERDANRFIRTELAFENAQVISRRFSIEGDEQIIDVTLFGELVPQEFIDQAQTKLGLYGLADARLKVRQGYQNNNGVTVETLEELNQRMRTGIIEDLYRRNEELLATKDAQIQLLENEIIRYRSREMPIEDLVREVQTINENVSELAVTPGVISSVDSLRMDTVYLAYVKFRRDPRKSELDQLRNWLRARTRADNIRLVTE